MADQNAAYARAEQAISEAGKNGTATLSLSGDDFKHLTTQPPDIANLTALNSLGLNGTQVSDIAPLAGLTALTSLDLDGTQVSDLSPLLKLTQLEKNPSKFGLSFENTAAAKADKRIAEMAKTRLSTASKAGREMGLKNKSNR